MDTDGMLAWMPGNGPLCCAADPSLIGAIFDPCCGCMCWIDGSVGGAGPPDGGGGGGGACG